MRYTREMGTTTQKNIIRIMMQQRLRLYASRQSRKHQELIAQRISQSASLRQAEHVFVYVSYGWEVPTRPLIAQLLRQGKTVSVPKITTTQTMEAVVLSSMSALRRGRCGMSEPQSAVTSHKKIDLALVPGIAFDRRGVRLGRGGGYYDRFFARHTAQTICALAWQCQIIAHVPRQPHDVVMDDIMVFPAKKEE